MSGTNLSKGYPFSRKSGSLGVELIDTDSEEDDQLNGGSRFNTNTSDKTSPKTEKEVATLQRQTSLPTTSSSVQRSARMKSSKVQSLHFNSDSDSEESNELGVVEKKKSAISGEYDSKQYEALEVNDETKEIFQYIAKYRYVPQQLNLDYKFKPFIPEFIPAVGDIDAFLKVIPPETTLTGEPFNPQKLNLGLTILDEPDANQSDPALLHLQLRAASITVDHNNSQTVVKKVSNVEKNFKVVDKWIKDVSELHRNKTSAVVRYTNPMPTIDELMQEWPEHFENAIKENGIPNSKFSGTLSQYADIICAVFDIPVHKNKIQSLYMLFCLYAATKTSQLCTSASSNRTDGKDVMDIVYTDRADHLVLD